MRSTSPRRYTSSIASPRSPRDARAPRRAGHRGDRAMSGRAAIRAGAVMGGKLGASAHTVNSPIRRRHRPCLLGTRNTRHGLDDRPRIRLLASASRPAQRRCETKSPSAPGLLHPGLECFAFHLRPPVLRRDLVQQMDAIGVQVARDRPAHRILHRHGARAAVERFSCRRSAPRCTWGALSRPP